MHISTDVPQISQRTPFFADIRSNTHARSIDTAMMHVYHETTADEKEVPSRIHLEERFAAITRVKAKLAALYRVWTAAKCNISRLRGSDPLLMPPAEQTNGAFDKFKQDMKDALVKLDESKNDFIRESEALAPVCQDFIDSCTSPSEAFIQAVRQIVSNHADIVNQVKNN
jgi:hypothetical protein